MFALIKFSKRRIYFPFCERLWIRIEGAEDF